MSRQEELELSRDGSQYSLSTGILPSLGGSRSNRRVILRPFIILPHDRRYRVWKTFLVVLVIYTAWVSPFEFGFLKKPEGPLSIADNVVNAFFAIDIVLTFFVAYLDKTTYSLVDSHKKIAWKYARSWLAFDVISTIPSELAQKISPSPLLSYGLFNMFRLWRLRRVSAMFSRLEKDRNYSYLWVRWAKLMCVMLFVAHCAGCFYYLIAARYHDPKRTWIGATMGDFLEQSLWTRYLTSIYWSLTTLTAVGAGDFRTVNCWERIFNIFYVLFILGLRAYLKELNNPIMEGVLVETENMLTRGRMDPPLSLCVAALRGDDLLLHQLLERGLDLNECDSNGRTALHIAASSGSENCVQLLLDHGADPNIRGSEGNVPLWEAMLGRHESVMKLLAEKGASLNFGEVGHFACTAVEQNNLSILKDIVRYGGDVTLPRTNMGTTALHVAVSENNVQMVKFLVDHGSDMDQPDTRYWTPRELADQQGHEEIKAIFASTGEPKAQSVISITEKQGTEIRYLRRFNSEPTMALSQ